MHCQTCTRLSMITALYSILLACFPPLALPQIPRRLEDEVNQIRIQHVQSLRDADQHTTHITDTLQSWEEFQSVCDDLSQWLDTEDLELASLEVFPLFLTEFLSLPSRFDVSGS